MVVSNVGSRGRQRNDISKTSASFDSTVDDKMITNERPRIGQQQQVVIDLPGVTTRPPIIRYYIDELGFYRHLDPEQRQYVCSNINSANMRAENSYSLYNRGSGTNKTKSTSRPNRASKFSNGAGDNGYEICSKTIRRDLGISHFDRTEDYENWKRNWDDFMRATLTSQRPIVLDSGLKRRVRSGIPHDYRAKIWSALIWMRTRTFRAQFGVDIYGVIVSDFVSKVEIPDYSNEDPDNNNNNGHSHTTGGTRLRQRSGKQTGNGSSYLGPTSVMTEQQEQETKRYRSQRPLALDTVIDKCFKQIELDLLRTLPNNRHFEDPNSKGIQRVRRVLRAYACFNQAVGYCQGMNRLAAMALLVLPEEEAFWCLVAIIQCIMPKDYYLKPWLAQVDCCVLKDLLEKKMPKLHKHLLRNDIELTLFTWFFTIFVDGFRPEMMLRIWDCFLLEGDRVLFRFALSILYIAQEDLLGMQDFSAMSSHLSRMVSTRKLEMEQLFESEYSSWW